MRRFSYSVSLEGVRTDAKCDDCGATDLENLAPCEHCGREAEPPDGAEIGFALLTIGFVVGVLGTAFLMGAVQ